ncbi:hypothetical protein IW261DRAFT_1424962 [Armillaria novae-zelandiae]|uniref:Uncharacterized protein n=1 Tax=Armillaria novae-zelandiae TaxID=153914 RepID=A0AA39NU57_9AGAR|nr:hypothetical protein IW261DRAFT_1424962 [Armillaria novae-zelandiae]
MKQSGPKQATLVKLFGIKKITARHIAYAACLVQFFLLAGALNQVPFRHGLAYAQRTPGSSVMVLSISITVSQMQAIFAELHRAKEEAAAAAATEGFEYLDDEDEAPLMFWTRLSAAG